jgi:5,10-methylenetetrahydromethanopterin reductase
VLGGAIGPARVPRIAMLTETLGFSELWLGEDYFFGGGIASAMGALSATDRLPIGLGIAPIMARHPVLLAMEIATISHLHPGRFLPGIGLGEPERLRQMDLIPASSLRAVRQYVQVLRRLLNGETVSAAGTFVLRDIELAYPPTGPTPLYMGAIFPKMLEIAGSEADGTVLSTLASPQYVRWARQQIRIGTDRAVQGHGRHVDRHRAITYTFFSVDRRAATAKSAVRSLLAADLGFGTSPLTDSYGISEALAEMLARGGTAAVEREMPAEWVEDLAVAGDPDECCAKIQRHLEAGSDAIMLYPMPAERAEEILETAAREVLRRLD